MFTVYMYPDYYPEGGFNDYKGAYDTLELAIAQVTTLLEIGHSAHIVFDGAIVYEFDWSWSSERAITTHYPDGKIN